MMPNITHAIRGAQPLPYVPRYDLPAQLPLGRIVGLPHARPRHEREQVRCRIGKLVSKDVFQRTVLSRRSAPPVVILEKTSQLTTFFDPKIQGRPKIQHTHERQRFHHTRKLQVPSRTQRPLDVVLTKIDSSIIAMTKPCCFRREICLFALPCHLRMVSVSGLLV